VSTVGGGGAEAAGPGFVAERHGGTLYVTLNRPDKLNALDWGLRLGLEELWAGVSTDRSLRCVVLTGRGRGFCAGADVGDLASERRPRGPAVHQELAFVPGWQLEVPVVVGVNGVCAGGGLHFVADADIVVAASSATFVDPHVDMGQVSGIEPASLALRVPLGALSRLVLLGRAGRIDAASALAVGLVSEVVDDDRLVTRLVEMAAAIEAASPTAVARSRKVVRDLERRLVSAAMQEGWDAVQDHWSHPDAVEGPRAFAEGRRPVWEQRSREQ
jgi:enoyl-CoA hydratase/carnithine racemase